MMKPGKMPILTALKSMAGFLRGFHALCDISLLRNIITDRSLASTSMVGFAKDVGPASLAVLLYAIG